MIRIEGSFQGILKGTIRTKPIEVVEVLERKTYPNNDSSCKLNLPSKYENQDVLIIITREVAAKAEKYIKQKGREK